MNSYTVNNKSKGITTVEFSVVALVFFIMLFAMIEVGRLFVTLNLLTNVTRVTARLAAVCPVSEADVIKDAAKAVSLVPVNNQNIIIEYFDEDMQLLDQNNASDFLDIRFVSAKIQGYQHDFLVPLLGVTFPIQGQDVIIPSESLGVLPIDPDASGFSCASAA